MPGCSVPDACLTHIAPGYGGIVGTTVAQAHNLAGEAGLNLSVQTA